MAVLETIRVKFGVLITALIAIALLSFLIDPNSLASVFNAKNQEIIVGKINGKEVTYQEFTQRLEVEKMLYPNATEDECVGAAWQSLVTENLLVPTAQKNGVSVTDDEVNNMMKLQLGDANIRYFADNMDKDANLKFQWDAIRESITQQMYIQKLSTMYANAAVSDTLVVNNKAENTSLLANVKYVKVPYSAEGLEINVTEDEISAYYNAHQNIFKQIAHRDVIYIDFMGVDAEDDEDMTLAALAEKSANEFAAAAAGSMENFKKAAEEKGKVYKNASIVKGGTALASLSDKSKKVSKWAFDNAVGSVSDVLTLDNNTYVVVSVVKDYAEGVAPLAQVHDAISNIIYANKVKDATLAKVQEAMNTETTLKTLAKTFDVTVETEDISYGSVDFALFGAVAGVEDGVISKPVKGNDGVYVVMVQSRDTKGLENAKMNVQGSDMMYGNLMSNKYIESLVKNNTENNLEKYF